MTDPTNALTTTASQGIVVGALPTFEALVNATLRTLDSERSQRVYRQTFQMWADWTARQGIDPLDGLNGPNVSLFLEDQPVTKSTRLRQLSALRTLAENLSIVDFQNPAREAAYKSLSKTKAPTAGAVTRERPKKALSPKEAERALTTWDGNSNRDRRNRALIAVLLLAGLRVSEAVALRWQDVDFENGVLHVAHGKGDKVRDAALFGQAGVDALNTWHMAQPSGREYVFCSVSQTDSIGPDTLLDTSNAFRIVQETGRRAGLEHFSPHDARRTLLTELLARGASLADVQAQAGHARGETTLGYAKAVDARRRRQNVQLRYG